MMKYVESQDNYKEIIYERIDFNKPSPLKVFNININESQLYANVAKHWHRSLEIIVPRIGETDVWSKGQSYRICANEIFIVNSKDIHAFSNPLNSPNYFGYVIQINYSFLKSCTSSYDLINFEAHLNSNENTNLFNLLNDIISEAYSKNEYSNLELYSLAYQLIYTLLNNYTYIEPQHHMPTSTKQRDLVVDILYYLDSTAILDFNASKVAEHFNMSYGYLAHIFKMHLNMTMSEYVNIQRIKKCENDLLTCDSPIIDIALENGFVSTKAFYQAFKKHHKMTPKQFRQLNK